MAVYQGFPLSPGIAFSLFTLGIEMSCARSDVANFIVKNATQDAGAALIAGLLHPLDRQRCNVQPARFEHHRHNREPGGDIVAGIMRGPPQAIVGRQGAILAAHGPQMPVEQREMHRFISGDFQKIANESLAHPGSKPARHIEREVNGDEFDMGERVEQRDPALERLSAAAARHVTRREQLRVTGPSGPSGPFGHCFGKSESKPPQPPITGSAAGEANLGVGLARSQCGGNCPADRGSGRDQSACAASSTSCAWPLTFTLFQTRAILPSPSIR